MGEVSVGSLSNGQAFAVDLGDRVLKYRLLYANNCRAYVEPIDKGNRQIVDSEGTVLAEFEDRSGRVNIAPMTMCTPISHEERRTMADSMMKRGGDRHFPAKIQERPVRPNTTRSKMLDFINDSLTGDTDIKEIMAKFEMDRNLIVAHIHEMHKCHGYGYDINNDILVITEPVVDDLGELL